jgi:hypothetical protein
VKRTFISRLSFICLGVSLVSISTEATQAQGASPQAGNAASALAQLAAAFSGSLTVQSVQLSGTAAWYEGSLEDSGTVNLTSAANGSSQMQLSLATTGQITETQTGTGSSATCQWSGEDAVVHSVDLGNCWRPALWFLPPLSLQPSVLSNEQAITDLGEGTVGSGETVYRHLQGQITPSGSWPSSNALSELISRTTTDIGLDPTSFLPAVLAYSVYPNSGAPVSIPIEIYYSDYHAVAGVQIPFHIERYLNGSLQLDIHVSSATVN